MRIIDFNKKISLKIFEDVKSLNNELANLLINELKKGLCIVPGGNTPKSVYEIVSKKIF